MAENDDMRGLVRAEFERLADNSQAAADYPELADQSSEFFKATAFEMRQIREGTPGRVGLAAAKVEVQMRREGRWKPSPVDAAGGVQQEDDGTPSALQQHLAAEIIGGDRAAAIEAYKERANSGVNVSVRGSLAGELGRR